MKLAYTIPISDSDLDYLRNRISSDIELEVISCDKLIETAPKFDIVVGHRLPDEFFDKASRLSYYVIPFTGIPKSDIETLKKYPKVTLINSHYNAIFAAEHAWALLMASTKRIVPMHKAFKEGDWSMRYERPEWSGHLDGANLLLIGYGKIGRRVAEYGKAFRMRISAVKRFPDADSDIDFLGTIVDLPELLSEADYIVISLPSTSETVGLIGENEFAAMKKGVHIINVGRGDVIDEDAFYNALQSDKIGGAALDTWWNYPPNAEARSYTMPSKYHLDADRVVMSPHRSSHCEDKETYRVRDLERIIKSIADGDPINVVDIDRGY